MTPWLYVSFTHSYSEAKTNQYRRPFSSEPTFTGADGLGAGPSPRKPPCSVTTSISFWKEPEPRTSFSAWRTPASPSFERVSYFSTPVTTASATPAACGANRSTLSRGEAAGGAAAHSASGGPAAQVSKRQRPNESTTPANARDTFRTFIRPPSAARSRLRTILPRQDDAVKGRPAVRMTRVRQQMRWRAP